MTESVWSKKTIAAITVAAFLGTLAPISANAIDQEDTVTVQLDLGDGDGGGGGPDPCIGYSTLTLAVNLIELSSASTGTFFPKDQVDIVNGVDSYFNNDRTLYSANPFAVTFDADSCTDSIKTGTLSAQRSPVLRQIIDPTLDGENWVPAEMTWSKGLLASDELRASANLLFSDGVTTAPAFSPLPWQNPPVNESDISAWQVADDSLESYFPGNPSIISGTDGLVNPEARLIIFGDNPAGKWKVWFGFVLEVQ
jgi:hypothetical protein